MDTEKTFLIYEDSDIASRELSEGDLETARHYIEVTRHLQEIHHLFLIFKNNIDNLQKDYILKNGGNVFCENKPATGKDDYIAVNAHTINIISSGRTLVESMECYINCNSKIDTAAKKEYLDFYHQIYDSSFAYRLLIRLRDYSQHGHLPVSSEKNNYYFDLLQIANKPHYSHNKTFEKQIRGIIDDILTNYHNTPTIAFTETLAEFTAKLLSVYTVFWRQTEDELTEAYNNFQNMILNYPENVIADENSSSEFFVYDIADGNMHIVNPNDNPQEMFTEFKNEAKSLCDEYEKAHRDLVAGNLYISCCEKQITVQSGTDFHFPQV